MINLENLTATEAEALAYAEGFTGTARQFARIADLQRALGQAVAALDEIAYRTPTRGRPAAAKAAIAKITETIDTWELPE
jgi:hypothetical protein